jgi:hypothetical protein
VPFKGGFGEDSTVDAARARLVDGYWTAARLATSGIRSERLTAKEWRWAVDEVDAAMEQPGDSALDLLDDLMRAPGADPGYVGASALENLLTEHGPVIADRVADRARRDPLWREAVGGVWLDSKLAKSLHALAPFLPDKGAE